MAPFVRVNTAFWLEDGWRQLPRAILHLPRTLWKGSWILHTEEFGSVSKSHEAASLAGGSTATLTVTASRTSVGCLIYHSVLKRKYNGRF